MMSARHTARNMALWALIAPRMPNPKRSPRAFKRSAPRASLLIKCPRRFPDAGGRRLCGRLSFNLFDGLRLVRANDNASVQREGDQVHVVALPVRVRPDAADV